MKKIIINIIYAVAYHLYLMNIFYFINRKNQLILTYHNIIPDKYFSNLPHLGVSTKLSAFQKQIGIILKRFKTVTKIGIPNSCIITFDDGYRNNLKVASDILQKNRIKCVFFVPACYFNKENKIWVDQILMWVSYVPKGSYFLLGKKVSINSVESRHELWKDIFKNIIDNFSSLNCLCNSLKKQFPIDKIKKNLDPKLYDLRFEGMSIKEIERLKDMGHLIACHSFKHDILSKLNEIELKKDFEACNNLKSMYNSNYYAYPFGGNTEVSEQVVKMCEKYGYSAAFSNFDSNKDNTHFLGRISLDNLSNKYHIEERLSGFEKFVKSFST